MSKVDANSHDWKQLVPWTTWDKLNDAKDAANRGDFTLADVWDQEACNEIERAKREADRRVNRPNDVPHPFYKPLYEVAS